MSDVPQDPELAPWLGINEVAASFGVSVPTIRRRVREGEFPPPALEDGTVHRWSPRQLVRYREELERQAEQKWQARREADGAGLSIANTGSTQKPASAPPAA